MSRRFTRIFTVPLVIKVVVLSLVLSVGLRMGLAHADPTYTLSGVLTVNSVPIPNAEVGLNNLRATTDANGNYSISSVAPGNYPLRVTYNLPNPPVGSTTPYIFNVTSVGNYVSISGDTTKDLAFDVGTQTIHVVDTMGRNVANANVQMAGGLFVFNGANYVIPDGFDGANFNAYQMYGSVNTDASGNALVPVAAGVTYQTCVYTSVSTCQAVTPSAGTPTTVTIPANGTISGVLTVNGLAIPNANVQISGHNVTTDASGNYSISNVDAGNHSMYVSYTPPGTPITAGVPYIVSFYSASNYIYVDGDATKNLAFNIGTQTVHVVDTDGNPVSGLNVTMAGGPGVFNGSNYTFADNSDGATFTAGQLYGMATTDASGNALVPVAPGITYQTCAGTTCSPTTPVAGTPTTVTVPVQAPGIPTGLAAASPSPAPALHWNAVNGATHYNVYRDGSANLIATTTQPSYTDTTATPDGIHVYSVTATNSGGSSDHSSNITVVVDTARPVVTVTPVAGSPLSGTVTFNITISDGNALDLNKNKTTWVYLYNTLPPQKSVGAKVNLSNGSGTFTVDTTKLANGSANLDVGIVYDAAGNASGTGDSYFRNYIVSN